MVTDPVGDLIIRIKNAGMIGKAYIDVPHSRHKHDVAAKLKELGLVDDTEKRGKETPVLRIVVSYNEDGTAKINNVKRLSKPGRRVYKKSHEAHAVKNGRGYLVLSTPRGILTDAEARKNRVGGEALFEIW